MLLSAAVLVCALAAPASAFDVTVAGQWEFAYGYLGNGTFKDSAHGHYSEDNGNRFLARIRTRTQLDFIASESLRAVLMFEIGEMDYGHNGDGKASGAGLNTDGNNVATKLAYLEWMLPGTEAVMRMGLQEVALPSTPMGSPVLAADVAGILLSSPVAGPLSATAFWIRPFDSIVTGDDDRNVSDEMDVFGLLLPIEGEGWSVTPWGMYSFIGTGSGYYDYTYLDDGFEDVSITAKDSRAKAYWIGLHSEFSPVDNLAINLEAIYGRLNSADIRGFGGELDGTQAMSNHFSTEGWFLGMTVDYEMEWGTPGVFGWYSSGDKANSDHSGRYGRLPVLGNDGGSFGPTTFGTAGTFGVGTDGAILGTGTGTWGVGVQLADVTFIPDLSHTLRLAYYRGTNDPDLVRKGYAAGEVPNYMPYTADGFYLTDKDYAFEVNFDHSYVVNDNLSLVLELGYIHLRADKGVWRNQTDRDPARGLGSRSDDAYKVEFNLLFEF